MLYPQQIRSGVPRLSSGEGMSVPCLGLGWGSILHAFVPLDRVREHLVDLFDETDADGQIETAYHG